MRILFLGDVVGQPGRNAIKAFVPALRVSEDLDFVIANGENACAGKGIDPKTALDIFSGGVDVITGGNHSWDKKDVIPYIESEPRLLRPANYPKVPPQYSAPTPGRGSIILEKNGARLAVLNLMGRVHMEPVLECPFQAAIHWIDHFKREGIHNILIDFHAEATSEKQAFAHFLAGKVSAVLGSHTHVQTADERILEGPLGTTAYITDAGMTGPYDSVIGMKKEISIARFLNKMPARFEAAERKAGLHGVIVEIDSSNGSASSIRRISMFMD